MLEPRGAVSSTAFIPATDETARVLDDARECLLQGRIADALATVDKLQADDDLTAEDRSSLALIGVVAKLSRGDVRGATPFARELTGLVGHAGLTAARASYGLGEFTAARGQSVLALAHFGQAGDELPSVDTATWLPWRSGLARLVAAGGAVAEATALVDQELAEVRGLDSPYAVAYALRTQAAIAPTQHRIGLLEEALEVLAGSGAARLEAQLRTDLAGWLLLLQPDRAATAVALLRNAETYAISEELSPLLSRIGWLLERLGQTPDGELPGRLSELSQAERRVAQLVVTGRRNREIAVELGVSVKSVEWHVSHILRKLSIGSRTEMADALAMPHRAAH